MRRLMIAPVAGALALALATTDGRAASVLPQVHDAGAVQLVQGRERGGRDGGGEFRSGGPRMGGDGSRVDRGPRLEGSPRMGPGARPDIGRRFDRGPDRRYGGAPIYRDRDRRAGPDRHGPPRFHRDWDRRHAGHRHRRRGIWRPGYAWSGVWIAPGYFYGECEWMRRRAVLTGSPYWWRRYDRCVDLYYS